MVDERNGLEKALERLRNHGIVINKVVYDDNKFLDFILDDLGNKNQKDMWHKGKNLMKKFVEKLVLDQNDVEILSFCLSSGPHKSRLSCLEALNTILV